MILNEDFFADSGLFLLAISALCYVCQALVHRGWVKTASTATLALAGLSLLTSLVYRSLTAQFFALSNMYEALLVTTLGVLLAYLLMERRFKIQPVGWVVCLLGLIIMFYAGTVPTEINPLQAALRSYWRSIHVPPLLLSYGFFTLAFITSAAYLVSERFSAAKGGSGHVSRSGGASVMSFGDLKSGDLYDEVTYRSIAAGFPLLLIGVILGAIWANEAWGNYWSWDPKESMSLVTLLGYGAYIHMRIQGNHSAKTLSYVSVACFLLVLMTFVGVNMWGFGSLHSYGSVGK